MPAPRRLRFRRAESRLDPVRWRRPGRGTLLRMIAVATLLTVGAAAAWSRQPVCTPPTAAAAAPSTSVDPLRGGRTRPPAAAGSSWPGSSDAAAVDGPAVTATTAERRAGSEQTGQVVPPGRVGVPVRLAEPTALALVHPGDRVDLLRAAGTGQGSAVATDAPVLDVTGADDPTTGGLLLALLPGEARTAVAAQGRGFAVLIRPD